MDKKAKAEAKRARRALRKQEGGINPTADDSLTETSPTDTEPSEQPNNDPIVEQ